MVYRAPPNWSDSAPKVLSINSVVELCIVGRPISSMTRPNNSMIWKLLTLSSLLFSGALGVALPGIAALLVVNIAFGVISRAAPALNLFGVGFPIILLLGLVILLIGLPTIQSSTTTLMDSTFGALADQFGGVR